MMNLTASLLANIETSFWEDVNFQLIGFTIVLLTLTGIWLALEIIGAFFRGSGKRQAAAKSAAAAAAPTPAGTDQTDHELFAVIAAAVDTVIQEPHQVVSISAPSSRGGGGQSAWSSEGRKEIYRSHRIR